MNPYLTNQGKWLFVTGVVFSVAGGLAREPVLLFFGVVPFAILVWAVAWVLPGARSLDRRSSSLKVDGSDQVQPLQRNRQSQLEVWLDNQSTTSLRVQHLHPHAAGPVDVEVLGGELYVAADGSSRFEIVVTSTGIGRASLQGFDVELVDRWGLVTVRDYLPCLLVFETVPSIHRHHRPEAAERRLTRRGRREVAASSRSGTAMRELRDFQPGDPLRTVAWKATMRQRRLITREFDDERSEREFVAIDISSSMRAGTPPGRKFDHALEVAAGQCARCLDAERRVGLWSFDHDLYGVVQAAKGRGQRRRIRQHLAGLNAVVCRDRTAMDDEELREVLADYLLVQERLDFRRGNGLKGRADGRLLEEWTASVIRDERRRWRDSAQAFGVVDEAVSPVRRFFRLRGIPVDPPSEVASGDKISGLEAVLRQVIGRKISGGRMTIITDLCGLSDVEMLRRPVGLVRRRGVEISFVVPFTPDYASGDWDEGSGAELIRDLFARAEYRDRVQVAQRLEAMGLDVHFIGPDA